MQFEKKYKEDKHEQIVEHVVNIVFTPTELSSLLYKEDESKPDTKINEVGKALADNIIKNAND